MSDFITRFAPSPTGYLHLGHAYSAYCAFNAAQTHTGFETGTCLLRIEDTDLTRCRPEYEQGIYNDLEWLGFQWPMPVRRQSRHLDFYREGLKKLEQKGLIYRCFKTRREVAEQSAFAPHLDDPVPVFIGEALPPSLERQALEDGKMFSWRLSMQACQHYLGDEWDRLFFIESSNGSNETIRANPEKFGDVIVARKDTGTSYHMAVVMDDYTQNINHIIRGQDLFEVTHIHVLLQKLFGFPTPVYHHHPLLLDENGKRFAKRDKAKTLKSMRDAGVSLKQVHMMMKDY